MDTTARATSNNSSSSNNNMPSSSVSLSSSSLMTPSQAINSQTQQQQQQRAANAASAASTSTANNRSRNKRRNNKNKNNRNNDSNNNNNNMMQQQQGVDSTASATTPADAVATAGATATAGGQGSGGGSGDAAGDGQRRRNKSKTNNKKKKPPLVNNNNEEPPGTIASSSAPTAAAVDSSSNTNTNTTNSNTKKKKNRRRNKNVNKKSHNDEEDAMLYPWRRHIPDDTVDPITLDPLHSLPYPPFALYAEAPFDPIDEWPIIPNDDKDGDNSNKRKKQQEERQARILQEQWGKNLHVVAGAAATAVGVGTSTILGDNLVENNTSLPRDDNDKKHIHLYDGRALAYYMVSQLQFIDPLNRRDLSRDELINLDRYLRRHAHIINNHHHHNNNNKQHNNRRQQNKQQQQQHDLNVTEAYDAKGITLSSAGAAAHTDAGRAAIRAAMLQQEASILLNALFGGGNGSGGSNAVAPTTTTSNIDNDDGNALFRQYQAHQQQEHYSRQQPMRNEGGGGSGDDDWRDETGIHGNARGMLIIDDDLNPGLRGDALEFVPASNNNTSSYSASHIAQRYGHAARQQAHEFPSLSTTTVTTTNTVSINNNSATATPDTSRPLPKVKTLSKIGGVVKKTTADERQRQWEAREDARRRALLSNLTFNPVATMGRTASAGGDDVNNSNMTPLSTLNYPSEAQLERNRAFAQALGVTPATARLSSGVNSGWSRPIASTDGAPAVDEFGNELGVTIYPDALILQARERMGLLAKLEKKWKAFLADDKAASLPLNAMDRPTRTFVHHYGDFWKLQTESFDAEPKRYIHCVKLRDTGMPWPLLSQAVRDWKGPQPFLASLHLQPTTTATTEAAGALPSSASDHNLQQTAGQSTSGGRRRDIPEPPERTPLPLKPRSATVTDIGAAAASAVPSSTTLVGMAGAPTRTMVGEAATNTRFDVLLTTSSMEAKRERPKLDLQKRSLPLELPPFDPAAGTSDNVGNFDIQEELKRTKERAAEKAARERQAAEQKRLALEAAFASDDEDSDDGNNKNIKSRPRASAFDDSDDEWTEQEPLYTGNDDEDF